MGQRLIVEGKDAIVLTNICMKRKMNPPKGYSNFQKYKNEFVKEAGSIEKIELALKEELQSPDVSNIGIVVDANDKGAIARFTSLINVIENTLEVSVPDLKLGNDGCYFQPLENLTIGIWVMPNNSDNGYLEHFIGALAPSDNSTWKYANEKVTELMNSDFCEFTQVKQQKAIIHTYLSWKSKPGLPMGTAINANFFDATAVAADDFEKWFKNTFELET